MLEKHKDHKNTKPSQSLVIDFPNQGFFFLYMIRYPLKIRFKPKVSLFQYKLTHSQIIDENDARHPNLETVQILEYISKAIGL